MKKVELKDFSKQDNEIAVNDMDLLQDVPMKISVRLGQVSMNIEDVLSLSNASLVSLNEKKDELVELIVNDQVFAKGELIEDDQGVLGIKIVSFQ